MWKIQDTCKIAAIKVGRALRAGHDQNLEIESLHLILTQKSSATHPNKLHIVICFFFCMEGFLIQKKSRKIVSGPLLQFLCRTHQRRILPLHYWKLMLILCLKHIFFILPSLSAPPVSRNSRKFISGRVQLFVRRAHQRHGIPLLRWRPKFLHIQYDSITFSPRNLHFLSRGIPGIRFRPQKSISPSRSPTVWYTSASLAS